MDKVESLRLQIIQKGMTSFHQVLMAVIDWSITYNNAVYFWLESGTWTIAYRGSEPTHYLDHARIGKHYMLRAVEPCGFSSVPAEAFYLIDPIFNPTRKPRCLTPTTPNPKTPCPPSR